MNRKYILLTAVGLTLVILSLSGCQLFASSDRTPAPVKVKVAVLQADSNGQSLSYSATIEAERSIPLTFASLGLINRVNSSAGSFVHKGDTLAVLDVSSSRNYYEIARVKEEQAKDAFHRLKPLYDKGNLPEVKFVEVQTGLDQATSAAAIAKKNMNDCYLTAPCDGYIGQRSIEPGMNASPLTAAFTLVQIHNVFAKVPVPESEISLFRNGAKANIVVSALNNRHFEGTVIEVGVVSDLLSHTYPVKIEIANTDGVLKPGMVCNALLRLGSSTNKVIIPIGSMSVTETGANFVFCPDPTGKIAERKFVHPGSYATNGIVIDSGLTGNETIIVSGIQKLVDRSPIEIVR